MDICGRNFVSSAAAELGCDRRSPYVASVRYQMTSRIHPGASEDTCGNEKKGDDPLLLSSPLRLALVLPVRSLSSLQRSGNETHYSHERFRLPLPALLLDEIPLQLPFGCSSRVDCGLEQVHPSITFEKIVEFCLPGWRVQPCGRV